MNKVNPVSTSASASSLDHLPNTNKKRRGNKNKLRLPTPPPDPSTLNTPSPTSTSTSESKSPRHHNDAEFLAYLDSLQKPQFSRSTSTFASALATEDAFDHLDKLYKLMGQMLTLREQNVVLHRRIMDLERLRSMQDIHQIQNLHHTDLVPDPDSFYARHILCNILNESKKDLKKGHTKFSLLKKKDSLYDHPDGHLECNSRRVSVAFSDKQSKVSKWTKVKAAFKWEKASPSVICDAKSQDSGLGLIQPINHEVARYLRVPSTSEEAGTSPSADSGAAEISTPATLSSNSSIEDVRNQKFARCRIHTEDTSDDDQHFSYNDIPSTSKDDSSTSKSNKRTPWAKVKDIIHTRQSSKIKRHRLSAKSDEFREEGVGSENEEDVFEDPSATMVQSPEQISRANEELSLEYNIPVDVIAKYRIVDGEELEENTTPSDSKWKKVKEAFLTNQLEKTSAQPGPRLNSEQIHDEIEKNYIKLHEKLSQEFQEKVSEWERNKSSLTTFTSSSGNSPNITGPHEDTKELAFKRKMEEWEKIRGQPKHNMQLQSEQNLPPEFRKKLEEWKKIKKCSIKEPQREQKRKPAELPKWKSLGGPKTDLETKPLSQDFIKKYESWKQIKASHQSSENSDGKSLKTVSPKLSRKEGDSKKMKDPMGKETQWIDKEVPKMDREKFRVERDRQKYLDREERLSKIRRSLGGGASKKEVLVQTSSGFYRFEGISRKFTQKLYEWEKSRGIRPEESTFALLKSSCIPNIRYSEQTAGILTRSKSADSVMKVDATSCLLHSQQPSSLSLNELENLEKDIKLEETAVPVISTPNRDPMDEDEPEALIVEVEDIVEETASYMDNCMEQHFPVYQKQDALNMCETKLAPKVRRSESVHAQANYNLIEEVLDLARTLAKNESDIDETEKEILLKPNIDDLEFDSLKTKQEIQKQLSDVLIGKLIKLQEANSNVAMNITKEDSKLKMTRLVDVLDTIQDLTSELFNLLQYCSQLHRKVKHLPLNMRINSLRNKSYLMGQVFKLLPIIDLLFKAETFDNFIYKRNKSQLESATILLSIQYYPQINENLHLISKKILELRRNLSYIYAASDMAVSTWKQREQYNICRMPSIERKRNSFRKTRSREDSEDLLLKQIEQGAVKKRQRFRQKGVTSQTVDESDDDEKVYSEPRKSKPRRVRSQNSSESNKSKPEEKSENAQIIVDPELVEKILIPTKSTSFSSSFEESQKQPQPTSNNTSDVSATVFIKTTKKIFSPIAVNNTVNENVKLKEDTENNSIEESIKMDSEELEEKFNQLPPLLSAASPTPQRKIQKEISPNIRLMMVRYNQKLHEDSSVARSAGSSGSASPTAWRSPVLERRVKAQTEKYQQEIQQKMSPLLGGRREVQKSASMGVMVTGNKQVTVHGYKTNDQITKNCKGILKSSSVGILKNTEFSQRVIRTEFKPIPEIEDTKKCASLSTLSDARNVKIQRAKEEFLNSPKPSTAQINVSESSTGVSTSSTGPLYELRTSKTAHSIKNRLSQISVESESSCTSSNYGILMKSASAGMINIDPSAYEQFDPELHVNGCLSLPRSAKKNIFSNITSKFRKVKMRRHNKDKVNSKGNSAEKMNTVSTLCRQSLVVDIGNSSQETLSEGQHSHLSIPSDSRGSSTDTSPSQSRTSSWIKRPKLFTRHK